jgi:hypothetical protein
MKHATYQEIACQQVMTENASVYSIQWSDFPAATAVDLSAQKLLTHYLGYIRKCTLTLIRPVIFDSGIEFRLGNSEISLISFLPPHYAEECATLYICGGFLLQPQQGDRGELRFGVARLPENIRVSLQLSGFRPLILGASPPSLLRFWLYRFTQAAIHRLVTIRFLKLLYHELVGSSAGVRIINVVVRTGKPV